MLKPRKKTTSNNFKASETPLSAKQKAIAETEAKLKEKMERYQRLIEEAPMRAEQQKKAQREQFLKRAAQTGHRNSSAALVDRRFELNAGAPAKVRKLKAEKSRGRNTFFILLLVLAAAVFWLYYTVTQP